MRQGSTADLALVLFDRRALLLASVVAFGAACAGESNEGVEIPLGFEEFTIDPGETGFVEDVELTLDIEAESTAQIRVLLYGPGFLYGVPVVQTTEAQGRNVRATLTDAAEAESFRVLGSAGRDTFEGAKLRPYFPLGFFRGERAEGTWTLVVYNLDLDGEQPAVLRDWSLKLKTSAQAPEPKLAVSTIYELWKGAPADVGQEYCFRYRPPPGNEAVVQAEIRGPDVVESNFVDFEPLQAGSPIRRGCIQFSLRPGTEAPELELRVTAGEVTSTQKYQPTFVEPPAENMSLAGHLRSDELGFPGYVPTALESWTDAPSGRSFVIAWNDNGTSFVEVTAEPRLMASMEAAATGNQRTGPSLVVGDDVAYVSHAGGMQVLDLTRLLSIDPRMPAALEPDLLVQDFLSARSFSLSASRTHLFAAGTCTERRDAPGCKDFMMFNLDSPMAPALVAATADEANDFTSNISDSLCDLFYEPSSGWRRELCIVIEPGPSALPKGELRLYDVDIPSAPRRRQSQVVVGPVWAHWLARVESDLVVTGRRPSPGAPTTASRLPASQRDFWIEEEEALREEPSWFGMRVFPHSRYLFITRLAGGLSVYQRADGERFDADSLEEVASYDMFPDDNFGDAPTDRFAGAFDLVFLEETGRVAVADPARGLFILDLAEKLSTN